MRTLFNFLIRHSVLIVFLLFEILSFALIVSSQGYQKSVFLSSGNSVVAGMYKASNSVVEFFKLRAANENLSEENTALKNQVINLQNQLSTLTGGIQNDSVKFRIPPEMEYDFISAKVINISTNRLQNSITLNKGKRDGIKPDMGVVSDEGVVGIVQSVSDKFSVVIPILNPKIQINCKFTRNNYTGTLVWQGKDYRYANLNDIARHVEFSLGDSLVSSGFSSTFPAGIPVGTVEDFNIKKSDIYYTIKIRLAVNFRTLSHVKVMNYKNYNEQKNLEEKVVE